MMMKFAIRARALAEDAKDQVTDDERKRETEREKEAEVELGEEDEERVRRGDARARASLAGKTAKRGEVAGMRERERERGQRRGLGERRAGRRLKQNDNYFWPLGTWRLAALLCPVLICMPVMLK